MRRPIFIALLLGALPAHAGLHGGLGKAVAVESSSLIKLAADTDAQSSSGNSAQESLPPCGSTPPYSVLPTDLNNIAGIVPLGAVNPSGHTMPTDHIYFYMKPADPLAPNGTRLTTTLIAPADITVTEVGLSEYPNANPPFSDYGIYFAACRDVKSYYSHIQVDPALLAKIGPIDPKNCTTYTTGGNTIRGCRENRNIRMTAGEVIGTSGQHTVSFDFGSFDDRHQVTVVNHDRRPYDTDHTVCPVDYFQPSVKAQMESLLGRFDGLVRRTAAPLCADIGYDIAGTARGNWYKPGAPNNPEDPHLALVPYNVDPTFQNISCGTSVPGMTAAPMFHQVSSGLVDRDFAQVTPDGNVYCYDSFYDPIAQPAGPGYSVLITMPTATTLQVDRLIAPSCGAGPWTMSGAAVTFQR